MFELKIGKDEVKEAIKEYLKKDGFSSKSIVEIRREDYQEFDTVVIIMQNRLESKDSKRHINGEILHLIEGNLNGFEKIGLVNNRLG